MSPDRPAVAVLGLLVVALVACTGPAGTTAAPSTQTAAPTTASTVETTMPASTDPAPARTDPIPTPPPTALSATAPAGTTVGPPPTPLRDPSLDQPLRDAAWANDVDAARRS